MMVGLLLVLLLAIAIRYVSMNRLKKKREAYYQSVLRSHSEHLRPGMTRREVESYLAAKHLKFIQMCCAAENAGAYDDITKIGQENTPWYCSEYNIYIAFTFSAAQRASSATTDASDILTSIVIFRWLEGCL